MAGLKTVQAGPLAPADPRMLDGRSGRPKRVSAKMRKAIALLISGTCKTQKGAAERVGVTEQYFSGALRKPHIRSYLDDQVRSALEHGKAIAAGRLLELVTDSKSDHVAFDASKHVLAINGIAPPQDGRGVTVNVNTGVVAGYVIDLGVEPIEPVITLQRTDDAE